MNNYAVFLELNKGETSLELLDFIQEQKGEEINTLGTYQLDTRGQRWLIIQENREGIKRLILFEK